MARLTNAFPQKAVIRAHRTAIFVMQLLALMGERTMIQDTVRRVAGPEFASPIVVCNQDHRFLIAEQVREVDAANSSIVLEPIGRNTAPPPL